MKSFLFVQLTSHFSLHTISHCWCSPPTAHPFIRTLDKHPVVMARGGEQGGHRIFLSGINILFSIAVTSSSAYTDEHTDTQSVGKSQRWRTLGSLYLSQKNTDPLSAPTETLSVLGRLTERDGLVSRLLSALHNSYSASGCFIAQWGSYTQSFLQNMSAVFL